MHCSTISLCRDCKVLLVTSPTHVSGAIASVLTFTFKFYVKETIYVNYVHRLLGGALFSVPLCRCCMTNKIIL